MARAALLLLATALATPLASALCIDAECFLNLTWTSSGGNITFTGTCSAAPAGNFPVTWCGFGISLAGLMFPAESMILQIDQSGAVVIEDRQNIAYAVPACYPTQLSTMLSYSVAPGNASFVATWTRPITLSESLVSEGYFNITSGPSHIIAAILYAISPNYSPCSATLIEHAAVGSVNVTLL